MSSDRSDNAKWRISDIIEALAQEAKREEEALSLQILAESLRHWSDGTDRGAIYVLRCWFLSIPRALNLPGLAYVNPYGPNALDMTPDVKVVLDKLVTEAKRLNVPKRG